MSTDFIAYKVILETNDMIAVMNYDEHDSVETLMIFFTDGTYFSSGYGKDQKCLWKYDEFGKMFYSLPGMKLDGDVWKSWIKDDGPNHAEQLNNIISSWMVERAVFHNLKTE